MKLTSVKALVAKSLTVGLLAGAFVLAAPAKANAQQFAVGVQFGSPGYGYDSPRDYYARQRYEELCRQRAFEAQQAYARQQAWAQHEAWERHEAFERREAWERQQAFGRFGYERGDRDRDRRDRDDHHNWDRDDR
jgi:hypothetical protein